jgi:hypothetical protein
VAAALANLGPCLVVAQVAILAGAALVALGRHALRLRRRANYSLADALGGGAVGGVLGAAAGCAVCVVRDTTAGARGAWVLPWLFRLVPFGIAGLLEGAVLGVVLGLIVALIAARARQR